MEIRRYVWLTQVFYTSAAALFPMYNWKSACYLGLTDISTSQETLVSFKDKKDILSPVYKELPLVFRISSVAVNGRAVKDVAKENEFKRKTD